MIVSKKESKEGLLIVVTDSDLIGSKFEEGNLQLDLTKEFYSGSEMSKEEVKRLLSSARHVHLTGKEAVAIGIEMDLIVSDRILYVDKIPHAEAIVEN